MWFVVKFFQILRVKFSYKGRGQIINREPDGRNIKITISFAKTGKLKINLVDLHKITAPETGKEPVTALPVGIGYTIPGEITWSKKEGGEKLSGTFADKQEYTARVTLRAELKYSFEGLVKAGIAHNGDSADITPDLPDTTTAKITVAIRFSSGTGWQDIDSDGDGLTDEEEAFLGTDPNKKDTDRNGYEDG
ncbi:MAG: thrombospondin type 3 repeat-containing protein [Treponema sp.]|jgi:hypothetical protein|nr:thrombospondin type 3 repeat-containing protein [Treponema sp.]